jgi:hypothetical protein
MRWSNWFGVDETPPTLYDKIFGGFTSYPNMFRRMRFLLVVGIVIGLALLIKALT